MTQTLLLDASDVRAYASMPAVIDAVESAFAAYHRGNAQMPAKSYIDLPKYNGDFRSMPAYLNTGEWDAAGLKWVNSHPENQQKAGLPTVLGTMIYSDPETAYPLAIMDGRTLTMLRTGASAAVATDYAAKQSASSLGLVGAGAQAYTQLTAIANVRPIEEVIVSDIDSARAEAFASEFESEFDVVLGSISEAATCDILSTTTPVESPIVERTVLNDEIHINAMGADAPGKNELDGDILSEATIIVDDHEQAIHSGEINVPLSDGGLDRADIDMAVGALVAGDEFISRTTTDISVFDSTGLAIQDVAAAHAVYETAAESADTAGFDMYELTEN
ncbi:MAG: putative ornithine cyclodeaminase [Haloquadratum sp. J07HQX50]|jgi:L-alanine dehydrogenase (EC 1.4.1.1)|nr:MAG: putative ornithine cyclodeaminase [Haloquadratum sp. J07HQX50]